MSAKATIRFVVPIGYRAGDYAMLHGNGGSGDIDYDTPLTNEVFELFPNGAGIYGFGLAPFGMHRFGRPHTMRTAGFSQQPFGLAPFGLGTAVVEAAHEVYECGAYKFALVCYDKIGNIDEGDPEEVTLNIHIAPDPPTRLSKTSYDKTTGVLILSAA